MNIVQIAAFADRRGGGVAEVAVNVTKALAERGHDVALAGRIEPKQKLALLGDKATLVPNSSLVEVAKAIHREPMEVLHSHGLWDPYLSAGLAMARLKGVPTVISPHGMLDDWALSQGSVKKRFALATFEGSNLRRAICIHALTEAEVHSIKALLPGVSVALIPNGVYVPPKTPLFPMTELKRVLLFLGRVHPKKGIVELLEGFSGLAHDPLSACWHIKIAGWDDGGHQSEVAATIDRLGLADRVSLVGPIFGEDRERLFASASALALTSFSEGLPMVVLEAWARSRPVLLTPECNLPDAEGLGAAIMCRTGSAGARDGLRRLFALTPDELRTMGACGKNLVRTRHNWAQIAADYESLYHWILGDAQPPSFLVE